MGFKVLITGGAGFIGSFIADRFVNEGDEVVVLDNLEPQVHKDGVLPDYINKQADFFKGSVLNYELLKKLVCECDVVYHQAAMVGVGQSMYQVSRYASANVMGTSYLLDILANEKHNVKKVIVAASMSSYGEGVYDCEKCGTVSPPLRTEDQMKKNKWELLCKCGLELKPKPTPENKPLHPNSIYAITKANQEQMVLTVCKAYGIPAVALRYFNVYGPRQSLSNPYTGVAAIFMSRIKNGNAPMVFEDGNQTRDFVSVHDIVNSNLLALKSNSANYESFNVGSGNPITIKFLAETISKFYSKPAPANVTGNYRKGDVRHCFADISKIKKLLDYSPQVKFEDGMKELIQWSFSQQAEDKVDTATQELKDKGLIN